MKLPLVIKRILAYFIDCILIFSFFYFTQVTIFSSLREEIGINELWFRNGINTEVYVLITVSIPAWLYFSWFDSNLSRGTLGKRICRLSLTGLNFHRVPFAKNLLRTILKLLPWELGHIANNIPVPLMYDENPEFRFAFIVSGIILTIYIITLFLSKGKFVLYDKFLKTMVDKIKS